MGEERVHLASSSSKEQMQNFVRQLLSDVKALEYMLDNNWIESDVKRIGAEQEMCLINKFYKPACTAMEILNDFHPDWLTTELAQFNLEINLSPQSFSGEAFSLMETELRDRLTAVANAASKYNTRILLTGILPSLRKFDLSYDKLTPKERYFALMEALKSMRGSDYELHIAGIDELIVRHDSPLLEACNTSFQVHLQVSPNDYVKMYNIAQALAGPVLSMCANSPVLFGKRLWHESRIALFQQSIDNRKSRDHLRDQSPRVTFGRDWLHESILEIYKEDITRFRIILGTDLEENSLESIAEKIAPKLKALQVHNGTVYRWNRPCYGVGPDGIPHLRIENRIFGAGPTVVDEMANAALWLGLMEGMAAEHDDITKMMSFDDAQDNFNKGAKMGIDTEFTWDKDRKVSARELMRNELLPIARKGLESRNIKTSDIDKYLGIIEERVKRHTNGARWILRTFTKFKKETSVDESLTTLTAAIYHNQTQSKPVHEWEIPELGQFDKYDPSQLLVEEFMTKDLITVHEDDILEYALSLMDWNDLDFLPVEDSSGHLYGIITAKAIVQHLSASSMLKTENNVSAIVSSVMSKNPQTVGPATSITEVISLMQDKQLKVLPVVKNGELVGVISEENFVDMSRRLIQRMSQDENV
jgi:CBS domain-containing protein/gamma-glutamylcysteine synthetase